MRQEFVLPEEDKEHLDRLGLEWETVRDGSGHWLLLHNFAFPSGFNHPQGSVAIQIPNNYPVAQLDMAYFFPHLARTDNQPIRQADARQPIDGKSWQRWSRHYTWVMHMLLGDGVGDPLRYAALAETLAKKMELVPNWHFAREYWQLKGGWSAKQGKQEDARAAQLKIADTYVGLAESFITAAQPSFLGGSHWMAKAVHTLREAKADPADIEKAHQRLLEFQKRGMSEMQTIQIPLESGSELEANLEKAAQAAAEHVKGHCFEDAIIRLAFVAEWERPNPDGWWIRARPGPRSPTMPYFKTPGADLFNTQPDGLWLYISGVEWADAICIEHCSSIQNLNDKRSRYMPSLGSILVRISRTWFNGDIGVQNNGTAPRWEATGTMAQPDLAKAEFHIPIRQLRVLYSLRPQDYTRWIPNHIPTGYEFFCTHPSLNTYNSPTTQTFLKRLSSVAHRLTIP